MVVALDVKTHAEEQLHHFKRRDCFPFSYSQLWEIETGIVRTLAWDDQGHLFVLGLWGAGDVVGKPLSNADVYRIECLSAVTARLLPVGYHCHRSELLSYLRRTEHLLQISQLRSVGDRLSSLLDFLAHQFGQKTDQGVLLNFHLTHQDIADIVGSSRVTITRFLNRFHQDGKICWHRKRFLLIRPSTPQPF